MRNESSGGIRDKERVTGEGYGESAIDEQMLAKLSVWKIEYHIV